MDNFSSCKVHDKLWSSIFGWGTVTGIQSCGKGYITLTTERGTDYIFDEHGRYAGNEDFLQSLFWDEVNIISPPKPKKKRIEVIEDVFWIKTDCYIYPWALTDFLSAYLLKKPPMRMTLEWEE